MGDCSNLPDWVPPDQEKNALLVKVVNLEKQLWKCVQSTGLMSIEAQRLYKETCSCFEKLVLCEMELSQIQDIEYSLWKLHYKHIDEFRRRIRQKGTNAAGSPRPPKPPTPTPPRQNSSSHTEGFKLFLSEATKFYQDLLVRVRKRYGFLDEKSGVVLRSEATVRKCQFMCHRFLICIGDLARYKELHDNNDARTRSWSVAATYYMKATVIWPDGGNSQNQLALLATYVGDEFLALFHCIRSLAVKEPFPDAWNNLMLLFEKNQSTFLHSISTEFSFDFSNPSARSNLQKKMDRTCSRKTELWQLFIRLISFFLTKNRSEDFPRTLGSTVAELEELMELDDVKLRASLETYQQMGASRTGPFKAVHIASVFIFVIHRLTGALTQTELEPEQIQLMQLSLIAAFVCIRCLVERCLRSSPVDACPVLPGVLVFLEWLAAEIDELDSHFTGDEKVLKASCYFFDGVVKLLNLITPRSWKNKSSKVRATALWEDFELQGFVPLAEVHASLDFSDQIENRKMVENGQDCRATRLCNAAVRIACRAGGSRPWICYSPSSKSFSSWSAVEVSEPGSGPDENSESVDEEEVILFKPILRHNSAPIQKCSDKDSSDSVTEDSEQAAAAEECLRRSKSLLITESQVKTAPPPPDPSPMFSDFVPEKPLRQPETNNQVARGPPSLNAWVLEQGSSSTDRPKDLDSICKSFLSPVSVTGSPDSLLTSPRYSNAAAFPPSTPRLRPGAPWPHDSGSPREKYEAEYQNGAKQQQLPLSGMLTSSEWLRQYREKQNLRQPTKSPPRSYTPPRTYTAAPDASTIELYDRWGNPVVSVPAINLPIPPPFSGLGRLPHLDINPQLWDKLAAPTHISPKPYGFVDEAEDLAGEPRPLLQYLKERELWRMQQKQLSRGPPAYMGT